ncbi:YceI family protein [Sphingobium fluviale]|uniref:Polyisoprenoid-binding protein n=1 Tax=Sphingobium fluviale TaxID=2506423 RepID=A0A4Q1KFJ2_9SPHN|nr:YceI family protein [Sphingobium fluviale]RXR27577.1 polyisoprenoid-binding protein [Sphingobium fluviale]
MRAFALAVCFVAATSTGVAVYAQMPAEVPGKPDPTRVTGGTYTVDPGHTQVAFRYNHLGFSNNMGLIPASGGSLTLDPKAPEKAQVTVTFAVAALRSSVPALDEHLMKADFFDAAKFPTATFQSTSVKVSGQTAQITGKLTIKGITKDVTLNARFVGAGMNAMAKKETVGFDAEAQIKRSDFGLGYGVPMVGDDVSLQITAAFEK